MQGGHDLSKGVDNGVNSWIGNFKELHTGCHHGLMEHIQLCYGLGEQLPMLSIRSSQQSVTGTAKLAESLLRTKRKVHGITLNTDNLRYHNISVEPG